MPGVTRVRIGDALDLAPRERESTSGRIFEHSSLDIQRGVKGVSPSKKTNTTRFRLHFLVVFSGWTDDYSIFSGAKQLMV